MEKIPKRRKFNDNPYTLLIENNTYYIVFKDSRDSLRKESVSKDVFEVFDENERFENSYFKEYSVHIEHSELSDISINKRNINKEASVEEQIIYKFLKYELENIISSLPNIQKSRLKKYYFDNKTLEEIANEEKCSKVAVKYSIDIAIKNISKRIKK